MPGNFPVGNEPVFFLARIGGLPAGVFSPGIALLRPLLERHQTLQAELRQLRQRLLEGLHEAIPRAPRPLRSHLLAIKRDCFNDRSLARHTDREVWATLRTLTGELPDRIVALEATLAGLRTDLVIASGKTEAQEERTLLDLARGESFARGLAVATPDLAERLPQYEHYRSRKPRKARGLRLSLLRYASRAAFKTSPYSTLTRVGLARMTAAEDGAGLTPVAGPWRESSVLRVKRYVLDQCSAVLAHLDAYHECLPMVRNATVEELGEGSYRFLVPSRWVVHRESAALALKPEAFATVRLAGGLVPWLLSQPADPATFGEWVERARVAFPQRSVAALRRELATLEEVGLLTLLPPWFADDAVAERTLARRVQQLLADGCRELGPCAACLRELNRLEEEFSTRDDPPSSLRRLEVLLQELWETAVAATDLPRGLTRPFLPRGNYYEDVTLASLGDEAAGAVAEIPRQRVHSALAGLRPIADLTHLYDQRADFLHTAGAHCAARWGDRRHGSWLEFVAATLPLWQVFQRDLKAERAAGRWRATFNPLADPTLERLATHRRRVWEALPHCMESCFDGLRLQPDTVAELLSREPRGPHWPLPPCAFLQPLDPGANQWVLNRIAEGGGRLGSRFSAVLPDPGREAFGAAFREAAVVTDHGEAAELVDLYAVRGDTLNVHAPLTPRAIQLPGERLSPRQRGIGLHQLRVVLVGDPPIPRLTDETGQRLLPAHLGGAGHAFMPPLVQLLTLFGPGQYRPVFPLRPAAEDRDGIVRRERLWCGSVLLQRRAWTIPATALPRLPERAADRVITLDTWRRDLGLPQRVFLRERRRHGPAGWRTKPQFINFSSPQFCELFLHFANGVKNALSLEEAVPDPEQYFADGQGRRWALELLVEGTLNRGPRVSNTLTTVSQEVDRSTALSAFL